MANFGGGIFLSTDWDLDVDESGDVRTVTGEDELQKDVAFQTASALEDVRGGPQSPDLRSETINAIKNILVEEPRVDRILSIDVREAGEDLDKMEVIIEVNADLTQQELVFEVDK